ncbi:hypothetical protein ASG87_06130 [Frateuria sp. Soil773]|uniref:hypothetical protein n=1 Tax=Frateuria sp. Soil773 TaxID=1736407 RepID=UPI0006FE379C|nr:hypothetical protein [Frateuria sp. Soil773]KRE89114.1 hypothetical protein ASG87_06130 [Frateuria sp. Soil773]
MIRFQSIRAGNVRASHQRRRRRAWAVWLLPLLAVLGHLPVASAGTPGIAGRQDCGVLATDDMLRVCDQGHALTFVRQQDGSYRIEPSPDDGFWGLRANERLLSVDGQRARTPRDLLALLGRKRAVTVQLADGNGAPLRRRLDDERLAVFRSLAKGPEPAPPPPGGLPVPPSPEPVVPGR